MFSVLGAKGILCERFSGFLVDGCGREEPGAEDDRLN